MEEKPNEITAVPELLDLIDVDGAIVIQQRVNAVALSSACVFGETLI